MALGKKDWPLLVIFGTVAVIGVILFVPTQYPLPTRIAAVGGFIAAVGGTTALRPLLRSGGLLWGQLLLIQAGIFREHHEYLADEESRKFIAAYKDEYEQLRDYAATSGGIFLVALGTLINGFSGFVDGLDKLIK